MKNFHFKKSSLRSGQVMLITSLVLASTLLASTTIAGLLMLYQLRQGSDVANSTKAIYAADAGLEWRLYRFFKVDDRICCQSGEQCREPEFTNGAVLSTSCTATPADGSQAVVIRSTGIANKNARAFEFNFTASSP